MRILFFMLFCYRVIPAPGQELHILESGINTNLRGISIYKGTLWISGSNGYTARSTDNGATWKWQQISGYTKNDFRDIAALGKNTAVVMSIASPAYILKTTDGGTNWKKVYENTDSAVFLDAIDFASPTTGFIVGDPLDKKPFMLFTKNSGNTWMAPPSRLPDLAPGEAFFAASGSNIAVEKDRFFLVSGGSRSRLIDNSGAAVEIPLMQGTQSTGANGIAVYEKQLMIVGGDFSDPGRSDSVLIYSPDEGRTFYHPDIGPGGYRSAVAAVTGDIWICCGLNGVDITYDGGKTWKLISAAAFNSIAVDRRNTTVYLAGPKGSIGKIALSEKKQGR